MVEEARTVLNTDVSGECGNPGWEPEWGGLRQHSKANSGEVEIVIPHSHINV